MRYTLRYFGIQVRDMGRSVAFYRDLFGMEVLRRQRVAETGGEWAELKSRDSDHVLELNWYPEGSTYFKGPYRNGDELDHVAFECEDVGRAYAELLAKGAGPGLPPFLEARTWLAYVVDPDGIWIELYGKTAADPQP
ncbi:MAG: VOC family protein [Candidatus Thermoplasmatota archaeon]